MPTTFPGESAQYRAARERLLEQEKELRRAAEAVAAARRELPPGGAVPEDYVFEDAGPRSVKLSELFAPGKDTLAIYGFMFPRSPDSDEPCPGCTAMLDALDGAARHVGQRVNLAVVAKAPLARILAHAEDRGWRHLRLLSSAGITYNRDYFAETEPGAQMPILNVFRRDDGTIRHFWGSELLYEPTEPGQDPRHTDGIDPVWGLFDVTPEGRGTDWFPSLRYSDAA
jgi:predicted dithiol-disulfide oxidoreductase (DUF899 family)